MRLHNDTHPDAEKAQIEIIRNMSVSQRISGMISMSELMIRLSRRAILRQNPEFSEHEVDHAFIALHYGQDLADRIRDYTEENSR